MFYEHIHSSNNNYLMLFQEIRENFDFPLHLHENYEFIYVEDGFLRVEINGCSFDVMSGEGAFILPNQPHRFSTPEHSKSWLVIFSSDHISELKKLTSEKKLFHPVIQVGTPDLHGRLLRAQSNPLRLRSILYELAALYYEGEQAPHLAIDDGSLVCRVVEFIDTHYAEPMTLEDISQALGYSYRYMSGVINRFFKLPLPKVVNRYRVSYACEMLATTETEITEIALLCGFGSLRSFNRSFKEITGVSPREYKNGKR